MAYEPTLVDFIIAWTLQAMLITTGIMCILYAMGWCVKLPKE